MIVNQLAREAAVPSHVVRYYARIGLLEPIRQPENGYRLFRPSDVKRLNFIREAQRLGFTLSEIRALLSSNERGTPTCCGTMKDTLRRRLMETRQKIEELKALEKRMENALAQWGDPGGCTTGNGPVCPRIERCGRE